MLMFLSKVFIVELGDGVPKGVGTKGVTTGFQNGSRMLDTSAIRGPQRLFLDHPRAI